MLLSSETSVFAYIFGVGDRTGKSGGVLKDGLYTQVKPYCDLEGFQ